MSNRFLSFFLILFSFFFLSTEVFAQEKQVSLVNPIRGNDFWEHQHSILDTPKAQYEQIVKNNLGATWLLRYDALKETVVIDFAKSLNDKQEVGLFLEVTPSFARDSDVKYNESPNWHYPKSVFFTGYAQGDRIKLIDQAFKRYKEVFNRNPKSVGAWWIDAFSLGYMREKYQIEANLDVADQFSTDQYQIWGQYWSTPFYPSSKNALMPAQSKTSKIGVVTTQWAVRDPYNGYGSGVNDSTYSVQANDYLLHDLDEEYFEKLLSIYPFVTVGLENDFTWSKFGAEYVKQIEILANKQRSGLLSVLTMASFAKYYQGKYPNLSPDVLISADDPLGGPGKVVWYQSLKYRLGWFFGPYGSAIRDLRIYNDSSEEDCFKMACQTLNMATNATKALDDVTFGSRWIIDEGRIEDLKVQTQPETLSISYKNQSGNSRTIKMLANDLEVNGKVYTIPGAIQEMYNQTTTLDKNLNSQITEPKIDIKFTLINQSVGLLKFGVFLIIFLLLPGWVISRRLLFSVPLGIALFSLIAYITGFAKLPILIWFLPLVSLIALWKFGLPKVKIRPRKLDLIALGVLLLGSISWLLTTVKNGLLYDFGYGYWGPNGHDAIWHLSLIEQLKQGLPPQNPIFSGNILTNYHYLYDLLLAQTSQMFAIDSQDLLFRFYPLLLTLLAGLLSFSLGYELATRFKLKSPYLSGVLAMFFVYFGGSVGWIISLFKNRTFGGESMFWSQQSISTQINPPFAISVVLILSVVLMLRQFERERFSLVRTLPIILLSGVLIGFKAYGGVIFLGALGLYALEKVIVERDFKTLAIFICSVVLSLAIFLPSNGQSNALFIFSPLWLVKSMIESPDRLGWQRFNLTLDSGVWFKFIPGYIVAILIFLIGNLSLRVIGLGNMRKLFSERILFWMAVIGLILPLIFIQKGNSWNVVQFFYYTSLVLGIFAGVFLSNILLKLPKTLATILLLIVVLFTVPTSWDTLTHYTPNRPSSYLPKNEIEALNFLKKQPLGQVLTFDGGEKIRNLYQAPYPLFVYTSTAYVPALSGHSAFVADTINLEILGVDYKGRLNTQKDFLVREGAARELLEKEKIRYIYIHKSQKFQPDQGALGIKRIFENSDVDIYRVF